MTKSQAIKEHCFECAGDSKKEVTLCHILDCPLWPFRFGYSMNDKRFWARMRSARKKYPLDFIEMLETQRIYRSTLDSSSRKACYDAVFKRWYENMGLPLHNSEAPKKDTYTQNISL